jgi:hypothetical protein
MDFMLVCSAQAARADVRPWQGWIVENFSARKGFERRAHEGVGPHRGLRLGFAGLFRLDQAGQRPCCRLAIEAFDQPHFAGQALQGLLDVRRGIARQARRELIAQGAPAQFDQAHRQAHGRARQRRDFLDLLDKAFPVHARPTPYRHWHRPRHLQQSLAPARLRRSSRCQRGRLGQHSSILRTRPPGSGMPAA